MTRRERALGRDGRALEHHVLEEVGEAGAPLRLEPEADAGRRSRCPKVGRRVVLGDDDGEPVRESPRLDRNPEARRLARRGWPGHGRGEESEREQRCGLGIHNRGSSVGRSSHDTTSGQASRGAALRAAPPLVLECAIPTGRRRSFVERIPPMRTRHGSKARESPPPAARGLEVRRGVARRRRGRAPRGVARPRPPRVPLVVVVSALAGVTDALLDGARRSAAGEPEAASAVAASFLRRHRDLAHALVPAGTGATTSPRLGRRPGPRVPRDRARDGRARRPVEPGERHARRPRRARRERGGGGGAPRRGSTRRARGRGGRSSSRTAVTAPPPPTSPPRGRTRAGSSSPC